MIYFDSGATSNVDPEVMEAMMPYLQEEYGNPSSKYYSLAKNARNAVEDAREKVANLIGASAEEIVFTAGATESTNFIIKGYLDYRKYYGDGRNHVLTTVAEHKATINVCKYLNGEIYSNNDPTTSLFSSNKYVDRGYQASLAPIKSDGSVDISEMKKLIQDNTALVSAIYVNNEIGSINNISELADLAHACGAELHTDATQALGKIDVNVQELKCDFLSCSAHKLHGPKGVGAAFLKNDAYGIKPITALLHGGEQEFGFRAGTLAVHDIVGFGAAADIARRNLQENILRIRELDSLLVSKLLQIKGVSLTNPTKTRIPGIVSIVIDKPDFHNERFLKKISDEVALSTGSACSIGEPSHVIEAIGLGEKVNKILRITINKNTSKQDIEELSKIICLA